MKKFYYDIEQKFKNKPLKYYLIALAIIIITGVI
jgi:hypothetical protein